MTPSMVEARWFHGGSVRPTPRWWGRLVVALALVSGLGCTSPSRSEVAKSGAPRPEETAPGPGPVALADVMRQARFGFREEADGWRGGGGAWDVHVAGDVFEVRARRGEAQTPPLRLGPVALRRGGRQLKRAEANARRQADGSLRLERDVGSEHFINRPGGVEVTWTFGAQPTGRGDLWVTLPARGLDFAGIESGGARFVDAQAGASLRFGHGVWVDARGEKTPVPVGFEGGALRLRVPEAVLADSAYPAVLDPLVTPEFPLGERRWGPTPRNQGTPAIASSASGFLVVWTDARTGANGLDIYATRLSSAGDVLDPDGIIIAAGIGNQVEPAVASNGTDFLVVWSGPDGSGGSDIFGARVSGAGAVLDPGGITICGEPDLQSNPAVASNGADYLVAWQDGRTSSPRIFAGRVSAAGVALDGDGLAVSAASNGASAPALASNGANYLAAWASAGGATTIEAALLPAGGPWSALPVAQTVAVAPGMRTSPAVASDGSMFLVVWEDSRSGNADIYARSVSASGLLVGVERPLVDTAAAQQSPAIAPRPGGGHIVVWDDDGSGASAPLDVYGLLVDNAGAPQGMPFEVSGVSANQYMAAVATGPGGVLVVWGDERGGYPDYEVYGTRVSPDGAVGDINGFVVSTSLVRQQAPATARLGGTNLVVWSEFRNHDTGWDIFGARVGDDGVLLDPSGFAIAVGEGVQTRPAVASDGASWFVVWEDGRSRTDTDVYGARVTTAGVVLDPLGILITEESVDEVSPAVASDGSCFVVVWATSGQRIYARSVVGTQVGAAEELSLNGEAPSVAGSASGYLCAWRATDVVPNVRAQVLDIAGHASGNRLALTPSAGAVLFSPSVGSNGTDYFLTWTEESSTGVTLFGARVTAAGAMVDTGGLTLCPGVGHRGAQVVASDGVDYLVAWRDERVNGPTILGTRVFSDGGVEDEGGLTYASGAIGSPAIAAVGAQRYLVVDTGLDATARVERVRGRLVDFRGGPVAADDDVTTPEDTPLALTLTATSSGLGSVSFAVVAGPSHGALTGTPPSLTYTPEADFHGADAFSFTASADGLVSAPATVRITVTPVNDAPVATPQTLATPRDTPLVVTLSGSDVDGDALSYRVVSGPSHGALTGTPPSLTYTPAAHYVGDDAFEFVADDGVAVSSPAQVSITVQPVGGEPDAGQPDGGVSDGGVSGDYRLKVGCGCGAPGVSLAPWALLVAVWLRRRRTS